MDVFTNLLLGFETAFSPANILFCFIGTLLGTAIGVLPGVAPTATIAMLLPITFTLEPTSALIMLAGIYYGAQYGGSTTAILINLPGEASAAVTAIDGYQMAKQGRAGPALAIAALGSLFAGTVATFVIALAAPPLTQIAINFGSTEYFSLIVLGLIASVALAHGSILKALAMIVLGLMFGLIGADLYTGAQRFTFGFLQLYDGLNIIAIAVGMFGIAEILRNLEGEHDNPASVTRVTGLWPTREDWRASRGPILRGTTIGSLLGVLPGGGALLASFASYSIEKRLSKHPERFGKGVIEGVAGPESANNAGAQTSFIPMLTLGLPGNGVMALMIGALILHGIVPGPNVVVEEPVLFWGLIVSMWIGNVLLVILNLPLIGIWVRLLTVPYNILFPAIIVFSSIGTFMINGNVFDLIGISFFGALGYVLIKLGCEPTPFLIGFILGPMLEEQFRRAMMISGGNPTVFFTEPISAGLLGLAALMLLLVVIPAVAKKRDEVFIED